MSGWSSPDGEWWVYRADGAPIDDDGSQCFGAGRGDAPDWDQVGVWFDPLGEPVELIAARLRVTAVQSRTFGFHLTDWDENQQRLFKGNGS